MMTKTEPKVERLRIIAETLREIGAELDVASTRCHDCGTRKWRNWDEKQAVDQIDGALSRVEKVVRLIRLSNSKKTTEDPTDDRD